MFENLGICKGSGTVLGQIFIDKDCINISKVGRYFYALLNNRAIIAAKSEKEFLKRATPVLSHIVKDVCKNAQQDSARWKPVDKNYTKLVHDVLKNISDDSRPAGVYVLELEPDEVQDNKTTGYEAADRTNLTKRLNVYRASFKKFGETIENVVHTSGILLKTNLDKKMWGSQKVMSILNKVKSDIVLLSNDLDKVDCCLERSDENAYKIQKIISNNIPAAQVKVMAGKVITNFAMLKSLMSELAKVLHRLYVIDNAFKTCIGYPATWFFDGSIFQDFLFEYENLIGHLIKSASLETNTIEPLLVWKIKLTGV